MIERAKAAMKRGEFLHEFIPVPKELSEATANFETNAALVEKYGYSSWYDFCVANWGTKWDVGGDDYGTPTITEDGKMIAGFDSAWSPPIAAYEKLTEMGFTVGAMYYEGGMAYAGVWEDGVDDYYDLGGMNSSQVESDLPVELDEAFGISESMREYEEENQEELTEWLKDGVEQKKALVSL
jgi:hypothetical protein